MNIVKTSVGNPDKTIELFMGEFDKLSRRVTLEERTAAHDIIYALANRQSAVACSYDQASRILGQNFVSPEAARDRFGFSYSKSQLAVFEEKFFNLQTVFWCKINGFIVIAGPYSDLTASDIAKASTDVFNPDSREMLLTSNVWNDDIVMSGKWLAIRKKDVPNSRYKKWGTQVKLLYNIERVPNLAETIYGAMVNRVMNNTHLFTGYWVRTSTSILGSHICVGDSDWQGLNVCSFYNKSYDGLGLSSCLK